MTHCANDRVLRWFCGLTRSYKGIATLAVAGLPAKPRRDAPLATHLLERFGNQEGQFQRLISVEPWIAMGVVAIRQAILGDRARSANALGDVLSGHLDVDAAGIRAFGLVHWKNWRTSSRICAKSRVL